ncbi:unnamed protein product, partial [Heterosigma akashiwo]
MGLSDLFIDPDSLPEGGYGFVQLLFLLCVYGYILCVGSGYISDGSELLLLVPSLAGIVGSVILPILGAVPDGAIVLFSGMGPDAQEQLSVGVGALAGSTIMLLTLPWFLSVLAGRVSIDKDNKLTYTSKPKLVPGEENSLTRTGVDCAPEISKGGALMMITSMSYLVIQLPALSFEGESSAEIGADENGYALAGLLLTLFFFCAYLWYQWRLSQGSHEPSELGRERIIKEHMNKVILPETPARCARCKEENEEGEGEAEGENDLDLPRPLRDRFVRFVRTFFDKYDKDHSRAIDLDEIRLVFQDLNEKISKEDYKTLFQVFDMDGNGDINFNEFVTGTSQYIVSKILEENTPEQLEKKKSQREEESGEEHEEMPEEFVDMDPKARTKAILVKSFSTMMLGTGMVLLFSDPMVDVLTAVGERTGVPAFYVAFVLAPLASNASELIAAYNYAAKKTSSTILVSLSALQGAACMNNTFCLAVFFALIYFKGLAWEYAAETFSIIFVQV